MHFSGSLTQAIRNFAKSLEGWLKSAMEGVPQEMVKTKARDFFFSNLKIHISEQFLLPLGILIMPTSITLWVTFIFCARRELVVKNYSNFTITILKFNFVPTIWNNDFFQDLVKSKIASMDQLQFFL